MKLHKNIHFTVKFFFRFCRCYFCSRYKKCTIIFTTNFSLRFFLFPNIWGVYEKPTIIWVYVVARPFIYEEKGFMYYRNKHVNGKYVHKFNLGQEHRCVCS